MLILVSTIVLYGAVLPVSAEVTPPPNWFSGDVTLDGKPAPIGTTIEAFIQGDSRGNVTVESSGKYAYLGVVGDSAEDGMTVTFTVDGLSANENGIWTAWTDQGVQMLDLTAGDAPTGDITYPDITITAPTSGAPFTTATITVSGTASDNEGVSKVEVKVGSGDWTDASGTTSWSTAVTLDLGPNTIYARANDTSGNSREVQVDDVSYVVRGSEDTTPPTVSVDSPSDGDTFTTATITVSGTASDNEGVSKVEVKVGSGDWTDASGTMSWSKTVTLIQGMNTIDVRAIDDTGNPSETASATVARNPPGSTPPSSSGGISGGRVVAPGATPTGNGNGTQAESGETAESGTSEPTTTGTLTSAANAAKKSDAKPEENQGLLPGFEAVFAIAGLLAVTYLIRNRV
jgi:PGF-CTERM protein